MLDAVPYFFTNLILHNVILALLAFLLGLLLGWLLWAKFKKEIAELEAEKASNEEEIKTLHETIEAWAARSKEDDEYINVLSEQLADLQTQLLAKQTEIGNLEQKLQSSESHTQDLEQRLGSCEIKLQRCESELQSCEAKLQSCKEASEALTQEYAECKEKREVLEAKLSSKEKDSDEKSK